MRYLLVLTIVVLFSYSGGASQIDGKNHRQNGYLDLKSFVVLTVKHKVFLAFPYQVINETRVVEVLGEPESYTIFWPNGPTYHFLKKQICIHFVPVNTPKLFEPHRLHIITVVD